MSLHAPVVLDSVPWFKSFGDVTTDAKSRYSVVSTRNYTATFELTMNLNFMLHILSHSFPGRYGDSDISSWEPKKQSNGGYNNNYCLCQCIYIPKEQSDGVLYNVIVYTLSDEVSDDCIGFVL